MIRFDHDNLIPIINNEEILKRFSSGGIVRNIDYHNEGKELVINLNDLTLIDHEGFTAKEVNKEHIKAVTEAIGNNQNQGEALTIHDINEFIQKTMQTTDKALKQMRKLGIDIAPEVKPLKFNPGDKVKISQTFHTKEHNETIDLTGMEGIIISYKEKAYGNLDGWEIDLHGREFVQPELYLDLIQSSVKPAPRYFNQEYEDLDGVILQDQNKCPNFIMELER